MNGGNERIDRWELHGVMWKCTWVWTGKQRIGRWVWGV